LRMERGDNDRRGAAGMAVRTGPTSHAREVARKVSAARADARAVQLAEYIAEIRESGITHPYAIAAALNQRGVLTPRGRRFWMASQVRSLLARLARLEAAGEFSQD
jgi:hypothetical protein